MSYMPAYDPKTWKAQSLVVNVSGLNRTEDEEEEDLEFVAAE